MIVSATAQFKPIADLNRFIDTYVGVRVFVAVGKAQEVVVTEARGNVPVITGELRESIHKIEPRMETGQRVVGSVVADAAHAAFVEFGTGVRGRGTYPYDLPQSGVPYTGRWIYDYRHINWRGMPARPYMRPALDSGRGAILGAFK